MTVSVKVISENQLDQWDLYVEKNPGTTFFHKAGWYRVIKNSFGHQPYYLGAFSEENELKGILPLFENKSYLFGHFLVGQPFCMYGGAVADSEEIRIKLEDSAAELAKQLNVDHLELRTVCAKRKDWVIKSMHSTFIRELADNDEDNLALVKYKQRAVVRKSLKVGLSEEFPWDIDEFYYAYSTSVRNLGTPVFSRNYFLNLVEEFGKDCELVSIKLKGQLHCALMSFYFKDTVLPFYGGGLPVSRNSKAMDYMYFRQMCRAGAKGYKKYDFGRSKNGTGPYHYKRHWGFNPMPLNYQYFLVKSPEVNELNPLNPKYQLLIKNWKKLPLWVSQLVGPLVSRYLG